MLYDLYYCCIQIENNLKVCLQKQIEFEDKNHKNYIFFLYIEKR